MTNVGGEIIIKPGEKFLIKASAKGKVIEDKKVRIDVATLKIISITKLSS